MKRFILLFLICCLLFSLFACSVKEEKQAPKQENIAVNPLPHMGHYSFLESGIYFFPKLYQLYFYDYASKKAVPVCRKPACSHVLRDENCNANFRHLRAFFQAGEQLYFLDMINNNQLERTNLDGSQREFVLDLASKLGNYRTISYTLHYGDLLYIVAVELHMEEDLQNTFNGRTKPAIFVINLKDGSFKQVLEKELGFDSNLHLIGILDEKLYFYWNYSLENLYKDGLMNFNDDNYHLVKGEYYYLDLKSKEAKPKKLDLDLPHAYQFKIIQDQIIIGTKPKAWQIMEEDYECHYYSYNPASKKLDKIFKSEGMVFGLFFDHYVYKDLETGQNKIINLISREIQDYPALENTNLPYFHFDTEYALEFKHQDGKEIYGLIKKSDCLKAKFDFDKILFEQESK